MEKSFAKKTVVYFIALGLSFSSFCVNLTFSPAAMAMSEKSAAMTMEDTSHGIMPMVDPMVDSTDDCERSPASNFNCCLTPVHHDGDKSFEVKTTRENRQHIHECGVKINPIVDLLKHEGKKHLRSFQHLKERSSPTDLASKIVKRE